MANSPAYGLSNYALTVQSTTDNLLVYSNTTTGNTEFSVDGQGNATVGSNLVLSGTGARIVGDFTNATLASRVMIQTSTANSGTVLSLIPNGSVTTGTTASQLNLEDINSITTGNGSVAQWILGQGQVVQFSSAIRGSGTYLPMSWTTGGSERMRLTTNGNILIGTTTAPAGGNATVVVASVGTNGGGIELVGGTLGGSNIYALNGGGMVFSSYTGAVGSEVYTGRMLINSTGQLIVGNSTGGTLTAALVVTSSGSQPQIQAAYNSGTNGFIVQQTSSAGGVKLYNGDNSELTFGTNNTERMRITSTGNVGINSTTPVATLDVQGNVNVTGTVIMGSSFLRNRIINGAMQIAQRVSTNIQTGLTNGVYYITDRFYFQNAAGATVSAQQNSNAPAGFNNSFYVTVTSSGTPGYGFIQQNIEGYNLADFALGTSSAKAFTVSFWVYSNLTGTYSVSIQTSTYDYSYNATYTINASNTWQYVTLTIPGTALGTWYTDYRQGMAVRFSLISSASGTPNTWVSGSQNGSTNNVNWFATNGNTFYLTGVQLEIGSVATPFERKLFDQTLIDCQRYYQMSYDLGTVPGTATTVGLYAFGVALNGSTPGPGSIPFRVSMRTTPSISYWDGAGNASKLSTGSPTTQTNNVTPSGAPSQLSTNGFAHPGQGSIGNVTNWIHYTANADY